MSEINVNDVYEEMDGKRIDNYGYVMGVHRDGKEYCTIEGPNEKGVFTIEAKVNGEPNHTFIDDKMLDFMIEHRVKKENG